MVALKDVSLRIDSGEFVSIIGPSGCGKTTFLNAVDGLHKIHQGKLQLDGKDIVAPGKDRAMVFQSPSLLPWRTVAGNVGYGLELQGADKEPIRERVDSLIRLVGLSGWENHYPNQLSGGMQQRANLARALAVDPEMLLLDEPFANLDAQTREFMQYELLRIWRQTRNTVLLVTHQISEAVYLSDRVIVLSSRPGTILDVINIDIPRPRSLSVKRDSRFIEYESRIWLYIEQEVRKQGLIVKEQTETGWGQ